MNLFQFVISTILLVIVYCVFPITGSIPLTKCCAENELYAVGFDACRKIKISKDGLPDFDPPVLAINDSSVLKNPDLEIKFQLPDCPTGYASITSIHFDLYENGTLSIPSRGLFVNEGQYCLDNIITKNSSEPIVFAAHFCVPDPCSGGNCIRKCCPEGMSLRNRDTCQMTLSSNHFSEYYAQQFDDSLNLRESYRPSCSSNNQSTLITLIPDECRNDGFTITPNGSMFIPKFPKEHQHTSEYCVDYVLRRSGPPVLLGMTCKPPFQKKALKNEEWMITVTPYLLYISAVFVITTFIIYAMIPKLQSIHGRCIMCYLVCLIVLYIGLGTIQLNSWVFHKYSGFQMLVHFALLSAFTWLNAMIFDIWWVFSKFRHSGINVDIFQVWETFRDLRPSIHSATGQVKLTRQFILYSIYAWGIPFIFVVIAKYMNHLDINYDLDGTRVSTNDGMIRPDFSGTKCVIRDNIPLIVYVNGPIAVFMLISVVWLVVISVTLFKVKTKELAKEQAKKGLIAVFVLFLLMGVSWIVEAAPSTGYSSAARWVFTDFINFVTGIYIFTHFICTPSVRNLIEERFPILKRNKQIPSSSTASQGDVIRASTSGDVASTSSIELRPAPCTSS